MDQQNCLQNEVEAGTAVFQGLEFTTRKAKVVEGNQEVKIPISWGDAPSEYDGTVTAEKSEFTAFGTISSDDYTIALDNQEIWVTVCMGIQQKQESGQTRRWSGTGSARQTVSGYGFVKSEQINYRWRWIKNYNISSGTINSLLVQL